jgi:hypothetical protein
MKWHPGFAAAGLAVALSASASAVGARPPELLNDQSNRNSAAVSLAEFRQLQAEVQNLRQQVARLEQRVDALGGRNGGTDGIPPGGPGNRPGCPQCP